MRVHRRLAAAALLAVGLGTLVLAPNSSAASRAATSFQTYPAPTSLEGARSAGEPSIGVNWKTGALLYKANEHTYRVRLDAKRRATWELSHVDGTNFDPILFTDSPTGRTWSGGLLLPCSAGAISDDDTTWGPAANSCAGVDHQTIGAGPWGGSVPLNALHDRAFYYCAHALEDMCSVSLDGGRTFGAQVPVGTQCAGGHGHVKVSADGSAYLPNARCGPLGTVPLNGTNPGGSVTRDNGATWTSYVIGEAQALTGFGFDPSVATTPNDALYQAWVSDKGHPMVGRSDDHGATWSRITDLATTRRPGVVNAVFPAMVAGSNGRAAVAYLGSTTKGDAHAAKWPGVWDLYVSTTLDAGRTWTTAKVTTDPVQRGWICTSGTSCTTHRNLLDFMDAQVTADGRVVVGYADGCYGACAEGDGTEKQSTGALASIAVQWGGPKLR